MSEQQLSKEVEEYIVNLQKQVEAERTRRVSVETQLGQTNLTTSSKDQNVIELQLELDRTLNKLYHQLSGHEVTFDQSKKRYVYTEATDDRLRNFSKYGVGLIMKILEFYLNIDTLMAFYDENTIKWKVKDFGVELADLFDQRSDFMIFYPTPEELFNKYKPIIERKRLGINDEELYKKCIQWSEEELAGKENILPIICWALINLVHSTYTRAFQGKERTSLGERGININQSNAGEIPLQIPINKGGFLSRLKG